MYKLTQPQLGIFLECVRFPQSAQYSLPACLELDKLVDIDRLIDAWKKLFDLTAVLHMHFGYDENGVPMQWYDEKISLPISTRSCTESEAREYMKNGFVRPFDVLSGEPLIRIEILQTETKSFMLIDVHHLLCDALSYSTLVTRQLGKVYAGNDLPLDDYFFNYTQEEDERFSSPLYTEAYNYFTERFKNEEFVTLSNTSETEGRMIFASANLNKSECDSWSRVHGVRTDILFQAAFSHVMGVLSGNDSVAYCSAHHGRTSRAMMRCMGMFVNNVPVKADVSADVRVCDLFSALRSEMDKAYSYAVVPMSHLSEKTGLVPKVSFNYRPVNLETRIGSSWCKGYQIPRSPIHSDMNIHIELEGDDYVVFADSSDAVNSIETLEMVTSGIVSVVKNMMNGYEEPLKNIPLVTPEEQADIVAESKGRTLDYDKTVTWVDMFTSHAAKQPDHPAVTDEFGTYTYSELDRISSSVAAYLIDKGVQKNDFVIVKMDRCKEYLAGVIGVNKAGAAFIPVDPEYPKDRIEYMTADSGASIMLTEESVRDAAKNFSDAGEINYSEPNGYAYMIYTSGSTGKPKGVIQPHKSLRAFIAWRCDVLGIDENAIHAQYPSFAFDASLDDLVCPIAGGGSVHILSDALRRDMDGMYKYIKENHIKGFTLPTQMGMAMLSQYGGDLPCEFLMMGGEKMLPVSADRLKVINGYGPTEFTVCSSFHIVDPEKDKDVPIGRPVPNSYSLIIDRHGNLLPRHAVGELCLAGPQLAVGYHNMPEITKKRFAPLRDGVLPDNMPVYHTGDLACYNENSDLIYKGRIDFQVKLNGFRIELGEIETRAKAFDGIEAICAQVRGNRLCLYYTEKAPVDQSALKAFLAETLTAYMVPSVYVRLDVMPQTSNGKIDLKALPEPEIKVDTIVEPETPTERAILEIAAAFVKTDKFGVTNDLVSLGLNSLGAIRFCAAIHNKLGVSVSVADVMKNPTVRAISSAADSSDGAQGVHHCEKRKYYPLSQNQKGVYIDWEINHEATQYNIPGLYEYPQGTAPEALVAAVKAAIEAHSYIKTRLAMVDETVVQVPHDDEMPEIPVRDLTGQSVHKYVAERIRPFDLFNEPLYRFEVLTDSGKTYLFCDVHHIVYDGVSVGVFMRDVQRALDGEKLEPEKLDAYDLAVYEEGLADTEKYQKAEAFYTEKLSGSNALIYPDSTEPDGNTMVRSINRFSAEDISEYCTAAGITVNAYLQAAFSETMHRLTREENFVYLTVNHGRGAAVEFADAVGMFVKTIAVGASFPEEGHGSEKTSDFIKRFSDELTENYASDIYPYTAIVNKFRFRPEVMFVYQGGMEGMNREMAAEFSLGDVKFPINITVYPSDDGEMMIVSEADGKRYNSSDLEMLSQAFASVVRSMLTAKTISDISLMDEEAREEMINGLCKGDTLEFDRSLTWLSLFNKYVAEKPDGIAVADINGSFTYRELDKCADSVAQYLIRNGVTQHDFVIIEMDRVKEFAAAVIGVHKAGACYVPIDPLYPADRIRYMQEDSEAKVVLTEKTVADALALYPEPAHTDLAKPENNAYMIYTSGSTGRPKGAMIPHSALMNYVVYYIGRFGVTSDDRISHHITWSFDSHIRDFYPALGAGAALYIMPEEIRRDPDEIYKFLDKYEITGSAYATAMGQLLLSSYDIKQRFVSVGGEALRGVKGGKCRVFNVCGATEVTDVVCDYELKEGVFYADTPIGKPLANCYAFIVDKYGALMPQGAAGEICYAGLNIGNGYWKMPEKTKAAFTPCQFVEGETMYHTGDLGRYNPDGDVEYMGRLDFQVKLRGFRIELGEIESTAIHYPSIKQVAAAVVKDHLCLYYVAEGEVDSEKLRAFLAETLTEYMVPTVYMPLDNMPMTPSGKVNRRALPEPEFEADSNYEAPATATETAIAECFVKVLRLENKVGALDNFFTLGGDSIKAIRLVSALRQEGIEVKVADIMKEKTVRAIAACAVESKTEAISQQPFTGKTENPRWLPAILAMPDPSYYHQTMLLKSREVLDRDALQKAFDAIVYQHDMLRTVLRDNELFVRSADETIPVEYVECGYDEIGKICADIKAHFDMEKALIHICLIHSDDADRLFIAAHHLIIDGVSWRIILSDLENAYSAAVGGSEITLPSKTNTYNDFAQALHKYRNSYPLSLELPYWKEVQRKMEALPLSDCMDHERRFERIVVKMAPEEIRQFILADKSSLNVDINDTMLCAVCRSYSKNFGGSALSVQFEGHGREDIGEPLVIDRTVGWFTSVYPVIVENIGKDIRSDLIAVKESLHRVPNKGIGYNVLRCLEGEEKAEFAQDKSAMLSFNYLGETDVEQGSSLLTVDNTIDTGSDCAEQNYFGPDIAIDSIVTNGEFKLTLTYNTALYTADKAQTFADGILEEMRGIESCLDSGTDRIITPTDLGENEWSVAEFDSVMQKFSEKGEKISRIYPLTPMQESMLLKHITEPDSWAYRLASIWQLDVLPSQAVLEKVMERLAERHEVLRTAIIHKNVSVNRQAIVERKLPVNYVDISAAENKQEAVLALRRDILTNAFDLEDRSLVQITCAATSENSCYIIIATHHIIVDGWCMQIFLSEFMQLLSDELSGKTTFSSPAPENGSYEAAVREILAKDKKAGLQYWKDLLDGYENRAEIPSYGELSEDEMSPEDELILTLPVELSAKLAKLCTEEQATVNNAVELLWGLILSVYSRSHDAVFAKVVSGRDNTKTEIGNVVGLFINSVPVRVRYNTETTAREMLRTLSSQAAAGNNHDFCPLSEIGAQTDLGGRLVQSVIAFENYNSGGDDTGLSALSFGCSPVLLKEENFDEINVKAFENDDSSLALSVTFNNRHYRKVEIERILELFRVFAVGISENPDEPLCALSRLSSEGITEMLAISRGIDIEYDRTRTWVDMFMDHARENPDNIAVVDRNGSLTYSQLDQISENIAAYLVRNNVNVNDFVAVKMTRRKEFAAAVIGVNKAGAAYVPIDPEYPEDRIAFMLEDCGAKMVLSDDNIDEASSPAENAQRIGTLADPETNAYMIYTSGSTGKPKGVLLKQRAITACAAWNIPEFGLDSTKRNLHHPSFSFDASTFDLFYPLAAGAQIHFLDEQLRRDLDKIADYIRINEITGMTISTAVGMALLNQQEINLDYIMLGGEKFVPVKKSNTRLYNGYGPTEFTVCSSFHIIDQEKDIDIPIGRAVPNSYSMICDSDGHILPKGIAGELCLAGVQISEGYHNRPEQTAKAFTYLSDDALGGNRIYRTGDLARYNEDNELVYLGRIDSQVKLRGFRIELGEIENQASLYEGMLQTAAEVRHNQLVLYYSAKSDIDKNELSSFLAESLTEYMVPTVYIQMDVLPLTPNGKINRKALPDPVMSSSSEYVEPANETEKKIAEAMRSILGCDNKIGALDSFFELGGDSIKAIRLVSLLRTMEISLAVSDVMKNKTVRKIAASVSGAADVLQISQEPFTGEVGNTAIYSFFNDLELPIPEHFNQSAMYRCRERVDKDILQKAVNALTYQHDMLRAVMKDGRLIVRDADCTINVEEVTLEGNDKNDVTSMCAFFQSHIELESSLIRIVLFKLEKADYLFITAHHTIIDGVSWRIFSSDLEMAYSQLLSGSETVKLPEKTHTYQDYAKASAAYRDSYALSLEIPYWKKVQKQLEALPHSKGRDHARAFDILRIDLSEKDTAKFTSAEIAAAGLEVNDLLIAAVSRSYRKVFGGESLSIQFEGHGREDIGSGLVTDRTIGWFTSIYPVIINGITGDTDDDLAAVKEAMHRVPSKGVGYNIIRMLPGKDNVTFSTDDVALIGFNYMGQMDSGPDAGLFFNPSNDIDTGYDFAPENIFGADLSINCAVSCGKFELSLFFNSRICDKKQADKFAGGILNELMYLCGYLAENKSEIATASDLGENEWTKEEFAAITEDFAERDEKLLRIYPLTPMQEGMLLKAISEPESPAYRLVSIFELDVLPTQEQLRHAIDRLAAKHEVLRTAVIYDGVTIPRQAITDRQLPLEMIDLSQCSDPRMAAENIRKELLVNGFELQRKSLMQFICAKKDDNSCYLIISVHHIIVDGWCMSLYLSDLLRNLDDELKQRTVPAEDWSDEYGKYEDAVREILHKDRFAALDYWKGLLGDYETKAEIPSFGPIPEAEMSAEDTVSITVAKDITDKLTELCKSEQATVSNIVEMIWGLVIGAYSRKDDVIFAKVVSGRDNTETEVGNVVGLFINSIPVRIKTEKDSTARTLLRALAKQSSESNAFDFCPLSEIEHLSNLGSELFQSVMAFENYNSGSQTGGMELSFGFSPVNTREESFADLDLTAYTDDKGELFLQITFDKTRYRMHEMRSVLDLFAVLAQGIAETPDKLLSEQPLLTDSAKKKVIELSTGEKLPIDDGTNWLELFEAQCAKTPDSVAIVDSAGSYTYAQLDALSDAAAAYLEDKGLNKDPFIAIRIGRSKDFMVAVAAVHKAGCAYVPIDLDYPEDRVAYILENAGTQLLIDDDKIAEMAAYPRRLEKRPIDGESLAYMIFTSGSTGRPKGVEIRHKSLYAFVRFIRSCWELTDKSRITCHSNFAFDAAVEDLYPVLTVGGTLYIVPEEERKDVMLMREYIERNGITGGCYTTQFAQLMSTEEPIKLDYIVLGGEKMTSVPNITGRVINTYGPTEFTVDATYYDIDKTKVYNNIPIGRPLYNSMALVVDPAGRLVPNGMIGELCMSGQQISAGYHNLPEKTEEVFKTLRLDGDNEVAVYHTGDLVRYNDDGDLEYYGRIDHQVKLRGFRIELGEIANAALRYESIEQCAVQIRKENICLYYTEKAPTDEEALRAFMAIGLAEYMVPTVFIKLDKMPMTPNGKLDLKALPDPVIGSTTEYVEPANETEEAVALAVAKVLSPDVPIGALDNFFALGGDSIKAIRLVSALREAGLTVTVADVMKEKTVRNIAAAADSGKKQTISQNAYQGYVKNSAIVNYFMDIDLPVPAYFNQSQALKCRDKIRIDALEAAFRAVTEQHDMLRAVLTEDGLYVKDSGKTVTLEQYTAQSYEQASEICNKIESGFETDKQLFRAAVISIGEEDILFICAHHLIIDGVSWRILLSDLELGYTQALAGKKIKLPAKTHTYNDYANALYEYRDSYRLSLEIPYWEAVEKQMSSMRMSDVKDYNRQFAFIDTSLDETATKTFLHTNLTRFGADVNDLLLTAVCRSYKNVFGEKAVSVQLEGHGRENIGAELETDRTIGWFTSIYPVVFTDITGKIEDDLLNVKETLHRIPDKGIGYNVLRYLEGKQSVTLSKDKAAALSFNYLGEMDGGQTDGLFTMTRDIKAIDAAPNNNTDSDLGINALVMNGKFMLFIGYNEGVYTAEQAKAFAEGILEQIKATVEYISSDTKRVVTASDLGENEWTRAEFDRVVAEFAAKGETISRIYPLIPMQEGMLLKAVSEPDSYAYRLVDIYELGVLVTEEMLARVLDRLAKKHEVLRTSIIHKNVSVARQAITSRKLGMAYVDISSETDQENKAYEIREELLKNAFDLQNKPLFHITCAKKSENSCYLVIAVHHIIVDGWCNQLYLGDLFRFLMEEVSGNYTSDEGGAPDGSYEAAVRELLAKDKRAGMQYWKELLDGYNTRAEIPSFGEVPENERSASEEETIKLDSKLTDAFAKLCLEEQSTLGKGTMLAWGMVLQTYSRTDDAVFVNVVSGRDNNTQDVNNVLGLFINSVPIRVKTNSDSTARTMLRELFAQDAKSNEFDFCPLSEIQENSELGSRLFQTVFAFENYNSGDENAESFDALPFEIKPLLIKEEIFDEIIPACYMDDDKLCLKITYNTRLYRRSEILRVLELFEVLIREMTEKPDEPLTKLARLSPEASEQIEKLSTGETMEYDRSLTWIDLFQKNAAANPDHTAVVDEFGSITYRELDEYSDRVAAALKEKGVCEGEFVVIRMGRVKEFVVASMGIQKAGAAYVPIAPEYPEERVNYIVNDSGSKLIIDEKTVSEMISEDRGKIVSAAKPDGTAYMIYTSGSTGLPKGVMIPHRALTNFVHFYCDCTGQTENTNVLLHTNFAFDASLKDLVPIFAAGGALHILSEEVRHDLDLVRKYIIENHINGSNFVTQIAHILTDEKNRLPYDYMTLGGEKMVTIPNITGQVINTYGPTEFTIDALYHKIDKNRVYTDIPIGRPIPNLSAYIVDKHGNLVPQGVRGELCLAGVQMALGYKNLPEKTAEAFNTIKLHNGDLVDVYHTGDLCRYNEDGEIEYCGRIDFQVKFRGFRIELGEIESRAASFEGVKQTIALVKSDNICLYYTADDSCTEDALLRHLKETLADYMVPGKLIRLEKMPMTSNSKIDRKALPDPIVASGTANVQPETYNEKLYYDAAKALMPGVEFGVTDDLLALGMSSLTAMKFSAKLQTYNPRISVSDIMRYRSIRDIVNGISRIIWKYDTYEVGKPLLVCVSGIIPINSLLPKLDAVSDKYNIIIIEPVSEYYEKFLRSDDFDGLINFYLDAMDLNFNEPDVSVLLGFSWGGVIAAHMAAKLEERGQKPLLILGDSYFRDELNEDEETLKAMAENNDQYSEAFVEDFLYRHKIISELGLSTEVMHYSGEVIYLNAMKETVQDENDAETMEFKLAQLKPRFDNVKIIDMEGKTHEDLFTDQSLIPFYKDLLNNPKE